MRRITTMSVSKGVGIPVKLLHEAEGHIVTVSEPTNETKRKRERVRCHSFGEKSASI